MKVPSQSGKDLSLIFKWCKPIVLSDEPLAISLPSELIAKLVTCPMWRRRVIWFCISSVVSKLCSQSRLLNGRVARCSVAERVVPDFNSK